MKEVKSFNVSIKYNSETKKLTIINNDNNNYINYKIFDKEDIEFVLIGLEERILKNNLF